MMRGVMGLLGECACIPDPKSMMEDTVDVSTIQKMTQARTSDSAED